MASIHSGLQSFARPPPRIAKGHEQVIRHADRQPPWTASLSVAKKKKSNKLHIVTHTWSGVSQEKCTFNHSTWTLYTFKGFRGRIMQLIVSSYLVAVVPMHEFQPALSCVSTAQQTCTKLKFSHKSKLHMARYLLLVFMTSSYVIGI